MAPPKRLQTPEARAWRKYLRESKELRGIIYFNTEPWLWSQLQETLKKLLPPQKEAA